MAEIIEKTGKSYNIFDKINNVWNKISFWHKASDCEFDDGKTAQTKLGAINGITSDLTGEAEDIAASIKCVNQLNSSLGESTQIKTLWSNSELSGTSDLSAFNPQTIEINGISEYDIIGICHSNYTRSISIVNFILNIPNKEQTLSLTYSSDTEGFYLRGYYRILTISENGISFENGYECSASVRNQNNLFAIPLKIIGIKL